MTDSPSIPVRLARREPARNMARFYFMTLQPTLFGEQSLIRSWGRIGTCGQSKVETFASEEAAALRMARLDRSKRRRGYS